MDQVELRLAKRIGPDIEAQNLDVGLSEGGERGKEEVVNLGDDDMPGGADAPTQPRGDRSAPAPDLQTAPTGADPCRLKGTECPWVGQGDDTSESLVCSPHRVFECVAAHRSPVILRC
jgi:hypothetical protein